MAPQMLLTPSTKKVVADAASGGAWVKRTPRHVSSTGVDGRTPVNICNAVSVVHIPSPFLIFIIATFRPLVLNGILQVTNKRKSTSPGLDGNTQKLDAVVDVKLPYDMVSASIFSKVIGHKLSDSSSNDLYSRYRMNFLGDVVKTQTSSFMDIDLLTINTSNESSVLGIPTTRI